MPDLPDPQPAPTPEPKTYDQAYVTRLKNEAAESRTHLDAVQKERDELKAFRDAKEKADLEKRGEYEKVIAKADADRKALEKSHADDIAARDKRYVLSEARAVAIKAGIIDPSDVAALDLSDLRIAGDGAIGGLDEKIAKLKETKPHWFKAEGDPQPTPQPRAGASPGGGGKGDPRNLDWNSLSDADFDSRLNDMLRA